MAAPVRIELGVPGQIMPPAPAAVKFAQRAEADGFDAIWWPDHLMGWHPDSLWTPDLTPLATAQANPHTYFDPLVMMGAIGAQTTRLRVGVVVTDLIRRHPAVLAQTMLTLDHLTEGRPSSVSARASSSTSRRTGCRGTSRWRGWPRASR